MIQKIIKVGSSVAVVLSKKPLADMGLKAGDKVDVGFDKQHTRVTIRPAIKVDKELMDWTTRFIAKYRPALEKLAKE